MFLTGPTVTVTGNQSPYGSGDRVTLLCAVDPDDLAPTFKWSVDNVLIPTETSATLAFDFEPPSAGIYKCLATLANQEFTSDPVTFVFDSRK